MILSFRIYHFKAVKENLVTQCSEGNEVERV